MQADRAGRAFAFPPPCLPAALPSPHLLSSSQSTNSPPLPSLPLPGCNCQSPRYGVSEPYEKLKAFTRGQRVTQASMMSFVDGIDGLPQHAKEGLKRLTPANYIGNAAAQAKDLANHLH